MHAIFLIIDLRTTSIKIKVILCKIKIMKFAIIFFLLLFVSMFTIQNSFGKESDLFCKDGKILVYRVNAEKYACLNSPTAENWYKSGIAEPVEQIKSLDSEMKTHSLHSEKMTSSAALPDTSFGPQIDYSKGYLVEEIRDGLYWVTDGAYNTMFLTTGQGVIVVDAPPSIGENYLNAIAEVTEEPITHVIYSHTHNDHIGSASIFPDDAVYIAHKNAAASLEERNDPNRPLPTVTFDDTYVLEVGNQILELEYNGPMHEPGNIFIYAPNQKVLMAVDLIFPGWTPFKDLAMAQDVPAFLAAPDEILEYDFDVLVGGHLTRLGYS